MYKFSGALIDVGKNLSPNAFVDIDKILPSHLTVSVAIKGIAQNYRSKFGAVLKEAL